MTDLKALRAIAEAALACTDGYGRLTFVSEDRISDCERDGWHMYFDGTEPTCGAEEAGHLAAVIAAHDDTAEGGER